MRKHPVSGQRKMMTTVRDLIKENLQSNPPMDRVVTLVAEGFSHGEMSKGVSVLVSVNFEGMTVQGHRG